MELGDKPDARGDKPDARGGKLNGKGGKSDRLRQSAGRLHAHSPRGLSCLSPFRRQRNPENFPSGSTQISIVALGCRRPAYYCFLGTPQSFSGNAPIIFWERPNHSRGTTGAAPHPCIPIYRVARCSSPPSASLRSAFPRKKNATFALPKRRP